MFDEPPAHPPGGAYNAQLISGGPPAHDNPDLGPSLTVIQDGYDASEKWGHIRRLIDGDDHE